MLGYRHHARARNGIPVGACSSGDADADRRRKDRRRQARTRRIQPRLRDRREHAAAMAVPLCGRGRRRGGGHRLPRRRPAALPAGRGSPVGVCTHGALHRRAAPRRSRRVGCEPRCHRRASPRHGQGRRRGRWSGTAGIRQRRLRRPRDEQSRDRTASRTPSRDLWLVRSAGAGSRTGRRARSLFRRRALRARLPPCTRQPGAPGREGAARRRR
jgi:hypothetical protein